MHIFHKLDREAWVLLSMNGLHAFAFALSNVFVNVFLWKLNHNITKIAWYNFANFLAIAITFILAGWITKHVDRVISIRLGVSLQALFYLIVLILGTESANYGFWLGFFFGLGNGFFWLSYNVLYFEISARDNRDLMNGIGGFISSLSGMIAPLISGFIITRVDHFTGYRIIFGISLGIFVIAVLVSFIFKLRKSAGTFRLIKVLEVSYKPDKNWFWIQTATLFQGLREGIFLFLTGLLIFFFTKNELSLGTFYTMSSIVSLTAYLLMGRYLKPVWRQKAMLISSIMLGVLLIPFLFFWNKWSILFYGIGLNFFFPFYYSPLLSTTYDVIGENREAVELRVEYVVARELVLNFGRLISLLIFILFLIRFTDLSTLRPLLFVFAFVQIGTWFALRKVPLIVSD